MSKIEEIRRKRYGIVEGFYSKPLPVWSHKDRMITLRLIKEYAPHINVYFYAPKDDPFVVAHWYAPYTAKRLREMASVVSYCKENAVDFIFGLNPGLPPADIRRRKRFVSRINTKLSQLRGAGCDRFCLLFDDIKLSYAINDGFEMKTKPARLLVDLVNSIYRTNRWMKELWLCSPDYWFRKDSALTQALRDVDAHIPFIWVGNKTYVRAITTRDLKRVKGILGDSRRLVWWNNYPLSDRRHTVSNFRLADFNAPSPRVLKVLHSIVVNPMRDCYANLPIYVTFDRYIAANEL